MFKYCPLYVKDAFSLIDEGDVFRITIQYEKKEMIDLGHELGQSSGQSSGQSLVNKVAVGLFLESFISCLKINQLSRNEIVSLLNEENAIGFLNRTVSKLIAEGSVEHTINENPSHPLQNLKRLSQKRELNFAIEI